MGAMPRVPQYDVLLTYCSFRSRAAAIRRRLAMVEAELAATVLLGVDIYHRAADDRTLLLCHFDARLMTGQVLRTLERGCAGVGGERLDVSELNAEGQERLHERILPSFETVHVAVPGLLDAVEILARSIRLDLGREPLRTGAPPAVRFRRGQEWQAGRLCRLADDGMTVAASGPPRIGDRTQFEILSPRGVARIEAVTTQVTKPRWAEQIGAVRFAARFVQGDVLRRPETAKVLAWARSELHKASPPPRRRESRFPLHWPAFLETARGEVPVTLRDVSHRGLFCETSERAASDGEVRLRVPFDQQDVPLRLVGRVVRGVDPSMAKTLGTPVGFGLELKREAAPDNERFLSFVERVAGRCDRRIVIGAMGARLASLVNHFAAAGYLAAGASDPRALYERATEGAAPPELVLIDVSFGASHQEGMRALKQRLGKKKTPFLDVDTSPTDARRLVDAALLG